MPILVVTTRALHFRPSRICQISTFPLWTQHKPSPESILVQMIRRHDNTTMGSWSVSCRVKKEGRESWSVRETRKSSLTKLVIISPPTILDLDAFDSINVVSFLIGSIVLVLRGGKCIVVCVLRRGKGVCEVLCVLWRREGMCVVLCVLRRG